MRVLIAFALIVMIALADSCQAENAPTTQPLVWQPQSVEVRNAILSNPNLSEQEKIIALLHLIDEQVKYAPVRPKNLSPLYGIADNLWFIAHRDGTSNAPGRPEVVQKILDKLDILPRLTYRGEIRTYLHFALGMAGGNPTEGFLLSYLNDPKTSQEMLSLTLESMKHAKPTPPIEALPRLFQLLDHPWGSYPNSSFPGWHRFNYPLREGSCSILNRLGIQCSTFDVVVKEAFVGSVRDVFAKPVITIDRASLISKLRQWLLSTDVKTWKAASEVVHQIQGKDIQDMVDNLLKGNKLTAESKLALQKAILQ